MSGIDLTGYTEESVSVFSAALASADSILTDTALASEDQQKVDDAVQALTAAKDALVLKEETASDEDVESGNRNDSSTGSSEGSTEDPESQPGSQNYDVTAHAGNDGQKEAGDDAPKTGDSASLIFWAAAMALGAGLAGGVLRRKNVK